MNPQHLEILFGGFPRPPFGLHVPTRVRKRQVYVRTVTDEQAEAAIAYILEIVDSREVSLDDRFSISSAELLAFQALADLCGQGGPMTSEPVHTSEVELELIDEEIIEISQQVRQRKADCLSRYGVTSLGDRERLMDAYGLVFAFTLLRDGGLPRLATFH